MEAKNVRELIEAYSSVYVQPEGTIDEDFQKTVKDTLEAGANLVRTNPVLRAATSVIAPVGQGRKTPTKDGKWRPVKEDVFDVIKGHLLDEGYADTEEAALAIMANMSEEWRQSIVEQSSIGARAAKVVDDQRQGYHGDSDAINKLQGEAERSIKRLTRPKGPVVTPGLPGV